MLIRYAVGPATPYFSLIVLRVERVTLPPPLPPTMREPRLCDGSVFTSAKSMTVTLRIHQPAGPC